MRWDRNRICCGLLRDTEHCANMRMNVKVRVEMVGTVDRICAIIRQIPRGRSVAPLLQSQEQN